MPERPRILTFYKKLLRHFGPQGWWPTASGSSIEPQYHPRRSVRGLKEKEKLEICLGAILTQNTSWANVMAVWRRIHSQRLLGIEKLLHIEQTRLESLLHSSGYFRQKALRVRGFLQTVQTSSRGSMNLFFSGPVDDLRHKLLAIKGVGPETADSMLLYAAGQPVFVVDAYTRRIASRWGAIGRSETYDQIQMAFTLGLPRSADLFAEFHALLVELGKTYCKKKPECGGCPVKNMCLAGSAVIGKTNS